MRGWAGGTPFTGGSVVCLFVGGWPRAVVNASGGVLTSVRAVPDCTQPLDFYTLVRSLMEPDHVTLLLSCFPQPDSETLSLARVATPFIHRGHALESTRTALPRVVANQLPPPLPPPPRQPNCGHRSSRRHFFSPSSRLQKTGLRASPDCVPTTCYLHFHRHLPSETVSPARVVTP